MARFNLSSVFSSETQYSVLTLLKALIDVVESVDYTDESSFNTFKVATNSTLEALSGDIDQISHNLDEVNLSIARIEEDAQNLEGRVEALEQAPVPSTTMYRHDIIIGETLDTEDYPWIFVSVVNTSSTPFTFSTLLTILPNISLGYSGLMGYVSDGGYSVGMVVPCILQKSGLILYVKRGTATQTVTRTLSLAPKFIDTVTQL